LNLLVAVSKENCRYSTRLVLLPQYAADPRRFRSYSITPDTNAKFFRMLTGSLALIISVSTN